MNQKKDPDAVFPISSSVVLLVLDGAEARLLVWALKYARPYARRWRRDQMKELSARIETLESK